MTRQYHEERHRIKGVHEISQSCFYNIIAESAFTLREAFNKKKHFLIDICQKARGGAWSELRQ